MGDHQFGSFTQGIIDLLINTTGEFVTERSCVTLEKDRRPEPVQKVKENEFTAC